MPKNNGLGHNSGEPLTEDEAAALVTYYQSKILADQRKVDAIQVDLKSARDVVNGHFKRMTADLKFTRKEFEAEVIDKLNMTETEFAYSEKKRARLQRLAGLTSGEQLDLVDLINDTVDDKIDAEANGYRAGLRGDDPTPPDFVAGVLIQDWVTGWHRGQKVQGERFIAAQAILDARRSKSIGLNADEQDEDEGEEEGEVDPTNPEVVDLEARRLKKSGWTEPTPAEAEFETVA